MQAVRAFNSDIPIMGREGRVNQIVSNDDTTVDPDEDDPEEVHPPQAPPPPHPPTDLPTHSPKKELPSAVLRLLVLSPRRAGCVPVFVCVRVQDDEEELDDELQDETEEEFDGDATDEPEY